MGAVPEAYELIKKRQVWGSDEGRVDAHPPTAPAGTMIASPSLRVNKKLRLPHHQIVPGKVGCRRGGVWELAFRSWLVHLHHPHFRVLGLGFPSLFHHLRVLTSRPLWRTGSMFLRPEADDEKANLHLYTRTHAHTPERKDLIQTSETLKIFQCLFQTHSQVRLSCELSLALSLLILFGRLVLKSAARLAKFRFIMHRV